ncbi:MAG: hypothetical protein K2Q26_02290 [Bdellovibrionales bacterium]|nr:hypothetical protein [Bdellovibrionales bacterium]
MMKTILIFGILMVSLNVSALHVRVTFKNGDVDDTFSLIYTPDKMILISNTNLSLSNSQVGISECRNCKNSRFEIEQTLADANPEMIKPLSGSDDKSGMDIFVNGREVPRGSGAYIKIAAFITNDSSSENFRLFNGEKLIRSKALSVRQLDGTVQFYPEALTVEEWNHGRKLPDKVYSPEKFCRKNAYGNYCMFKSGKVYENILPWVN